jgi:chorismate mutase
MAEKRNLKLPAAPVASGGPGGAAAPPGSTSEATDSLRRRAEDGAIDEWRRRIDVIDEQLMRLLNSRSACAVEIGKVKRALGLPVYSPEREAWILERVMRENPGPLDPTAVRRVFERIIDESRRLERLAVDQEKKE